MSALACRIPVAEQMAGLLDLDDGWYDGFGSAYESSLVARAQAFVESLVENGIPIPFIYPTESGKVRLEWGAAGTDVLVVIDREAKTARLLAEHFDTADVTSISARLKPLLT